MIASAATGAALTRWRWQTRRGQQLWCEMQSHFGWLLGGRKTVSPSLPSLQRPVSRDAGAGGSTGDTPRRRGLGLLRGNEGEVFTPPPAAGSLPKCRGGRFGEPNAFLTPGRYSTPEQNCQAWPQGGEGKRAALDYSLGLGYAWRASLLLASEKENTVSCRKRKGFDQTRSFFPPLHPEKQPLREPWQRLLIAYLIKYS